ncbi:RHS repeat domain-containing protein [Capnocytophaga sp.]
MIFKEHIKDVGYRQVFSGGELRDRGIQPKSTGKGFLYTWNANGSLRSVTDLKGVTYRFRYDAFGRRLEKRRMASTFRFVWDGNVLLHETFKKDNSENTELTTWVFEGFVPTAKLVNGKAYSIISDHLGTPILAIDSEGNEVWNRQLDIYGRVKREIKASSLGDDVRPFIPFLYQGQYYDFETGLCYNRFRYYSPEIGAYISQDPIRLLGGFELYSYVQDSNTMLDLLGLYSDLKHTGDGHHMFPRALGDKLGIRDVIEGVKWYPNDPTNTASLHGDFHNKLKEAGIPKQPNKQGYSGSVSDALDAMDIAYKDFDKEGFLMIDGKRYDNKNPKEAMDLVREHIEKTLKIGKYKKENNNNDNNC